MKQRRGDSGDVSGSSSSTDYLFRPEAEGSSRWKEYSRNSDFGHVLWDTTQHWALE